MFLNFTVQQSTMQLIQKIFWHPGRFVEPNCSILVILRCSITTVFSGVLTMSFTNINQLCDIPCDYMTYEKNLTVFQQAYHVFKLLKVFIRTMYMQLLPLVLLTIQSCKTKYAFKMSLLVFRVVHIQYIHVYEYFFFTEILRYKEDVTNAHDFTFRYM